MDRCPLQNCQAHSNFLFFSPKRFFLVLYVLTTLRSICRLLRTVHPASSTRFSVFYRHESDIKRCLICNAVTILSPFDILTISRARTCASLCASLRARTCASLSSRVFHSFIDSFLCKVISLSDRMRACHPVTALDCFRPPDDRRMTAGRPAKERRVFAGCVTAASRKRSSSTLKSLSVPFLTPPQRHQHRYCRDHR